MKQVYTMADLVSRERLDEGCQKPARLAVLGYPVTHSKSPQMHQAALDACGIPARYIRLEIEPGQVAAAFQRLGELGFVGCNVTVPHKLDAMAACAEVAVEARLLGAVNAVSFEGGVARGFNTDGPGFARAIEADFGISLGAMKVGVLGAGGGAGQAIAVQCGISGVREIVLVNRTVEKLLPLAARLHGVNPLLEITSLAFENAGLEAACLSCDLLVNASSVGLAAGDPSVLPAGGFRDGQRAYDAIYHPAVTPFLALASEHGCHTANGLSMLVHQGALAFERWFPGTEPLAVMLRAMGR